MIKLQRGYTIEADEKCYILFKSTNGTNKKNEPTVYKRAIGYYSRIGTALSAYSDELDRELVQNKDMTLTEAIKVINESRESVKKLIREAMPEVVE